MSVAAGGKIRLAAETGESVPEDWALDATGRPTTDPLAALEGTAQPLAGYKGYGLAFMVAMLSAVLPGQHSGETSRTCTETSPEHRTLGTLSRRSTLGGLEMWELSKNVSTPRSSLCTRRRGPLVWTTS